MIRTLIVEDDFRVAEVHRAYTERVPGFSVIGTAVTGAEALAMVERLRPDLLLLDIHLPDMSGIEVLHSVRQDERLMVDVIAITASKDLETLRAALHGGIVHYIVKPFRFAALEERLRSYAALRERLARGGEADQREVDRVLQTLRVQGGQQLPKGLSEATLDVVLRVLRDSAKPPSAGEVARAAGISRVTARRYLDHLAASGRVELSMRYGAPGRPEHRYGLRSANGHGAAS
jgi:two-component system CitB family response regulator